MIAFRYPIPEPQFVDTVGFVIMETGEDFGEVLFGIEASELGGLNDCHGIGKGATLGIQTRDHQVFSSDHCQQGMPPK